ncbi:MAG: hypothetical protein ABIU05_24715 [Nitrospirales bacterium]
MTTQAKASRESVEQNQEALEQLIDESRRHYYEELSKTGERIARLALPSAEQSEAALCWALEFASVDLSRCSEGGWSDCRYEVDYIARLGPFGASKTREQPTTAATWPHSPEPEEYGSQITIRLHEIEQLPSKSVVRELQHDTAAFLNAVLSGKAVELPIPPSRERLSVIREKVNGEASTWLYRYLIFSDLAVAFRHHLLGILASHGHALKRCPGCSIRFLADRSNKDYCTPACRNRTYMRTKNNVPPERYGKQGRPRKEVAPVNQIKDRKKSPSKGGTSPRRTEPTRNQQTTTKGGTHGTKR